MLVDENGNPVKLRTRKPSKRKQAAELKPFRFALAEDGFGGKSKKPNRLRLTNLASRLDKYLPAPEKKRALQDVLFAYSDVYALPVNEQKLRSIDVKTTEVIYGLLEFYVKFLLEHKRDDATEDQHKIVAKLKSLLTN